ncbi:MAG: acetylxylan esterase [Verrucomicrobiales bacterium]
MNPGTIILTLAFLLTAAGAAPRALPEGKLPVDRRLAPLKDLNGYFPFRPPASGEDWAARSRQIRHHLKVATGLYPEPDRTPLNAVIHGRIEGDGFSVEKVYFESLPGFYLTGNLYRPSGAGATKRPGILCPHGHWKDGRFHDAGEANIKKQIEQGAEEHLETGRNPIQARCVGLARLGCTVFQYDMIGYCDNDQISYQLGHRFAEQRPGMISPEDWGLYSPQAESQLQSIMMLQSWNSIRAIDFMQGLPDVDPERIAVTGASGGGTQTFVVSALDPRVKVSVPAVMVSTAMQGGCTCENASLMRVEEGNVAFAALFAPKPLCVTAADDWTLELVHKGFPELRKLYAALGAPDNLMLHNRTEFGHNYNLPSRQAMYRWFNRHLGIGVKNPEQERPHKRLKEEQLTVWNAKHPKPVGGEQFERRLLAALNADSAKKVAANPEIARRGWEVVLDASLENAGKVEWDLVTKDEHDGYLIMAGLLNNTTYGEQLPAVFLYPKGGWDRRAVIWLHEDGKSGLFNGDEPRAEVKKLLAAGSAVCGVDLFMQGEFLADGKILSQTRRVKNTRQSAAYTFGYNRSLFVQRLHDVLSLISLVRADRHGAEKIDLIGLKGAGHWAAAAHYAAGEALARVVIETAGFKFIKVMDIRHPDFLPGGAKYGDIDALLGLAKRPYWPVDDQGLPPWLQ